MRYESQDLNSVCIVLRAAIQELEHTTNYVQRIVALRNIAEILKMLTEYQNLGKEIEHSLTIPDNVSSRKISAFADHIKSLLTQQIHIMESAHYQH